MRNRLATYSRSSTAAAFQALADPTRRAVLDLLRRGALPAGQIAREFPVSRPAISKHLRLLRRARLVEERREGRHRLYRLNAEPLRGVDAWLNERIEPLSPPPAKVGAKDSEGGAIGGTGASGSLPSDFRISY